MSISEEKLNKESQSDNGPNILRRVGQPEMRSLRLPCRPKGSIFSTLTSTSQTYDLALVWNWEYDAEFISVIEEAARDRDITTYQIHRHNVGETYELIKEKRLFFRTVLDRASDEDEAFHPLAHEFARKTPPFVINSYEKLKRAADKATMHLELMTYGVHVPYTIIISPYNHRKEVELSLTDLAKLGRPFIIKPANTTGGGVGVVTGAETLKDVIETRQHHKNDKYLLQEAIRPGYLSDNRGWFRVFYVLGTIIPCWWDDQTHLYEMVQPEEETAFGLHPLRHITSVIQQACQLDFFSTEIVFTTNEQFVAVDYVNEMCDMRLQSKHIDGVPDQVVRSIAAALVNFVKQKKELILRRNG